MRYIKEVMCSNKYKYMVRELDKEFKKTENVLLTAAKYKAMVICLQAEIYMNQGCYDELDLVILNA